MQTSPLRRGLYYTLLWLIAIFFFLPVFWIVLASLKTPNDILAVPPKFAFSPTLQNIARTLAQPNTIPYFLHSLMLSAHVT